MKTILTTGKAAKVMGVAPRTVSKLFDSGELKGFRIPNSNDRRIESHSVVAFLVTNGMSRDSAEKLLLFHGFSVNPLSSQPAVNAEKMASSSKTRDGRLML